MNQRLFIWILAGLASVALLIALIQLPRTPLPWGDEVLFVSTARAIAAGQPGVPSVLADFPHTGRLDLFYGSIPFWVGAGSLRLFGLSLWSWRVLSWISGVILVLACAWFVLLLSGSRTYAALAAALVVMDPAVGSSLTSGRLDTLAIACQILALCFLVGKRSLLSSGASGLLLATAVLCTPRMQPFVAGLAVVLTIHALATKNRDFLGKLAVAGSTALAAVTAWTFYEGLTPWSWFQYVLKVSSGDKTNSSPLLHGRWGGLDASPHLFIVPALTLVWMGLLVFRRIRDKRALGPAGIVFMALLCSAGLTLSLISRPFSYEIFWLLPWLPLAAAITAIYEPGPKLTGSPMFLVLLASLVGTVMVRSGKVGEVLLSWRARDPRPISEFICTNIPQHSVVYGTPDFYYYGVEQCGSTYLYAQKWVGGGVSSAIDQERYQSGAFLIWPAQTPLPTGLRAHKVAEFRGLGNKVEATPSAATGIVARLLRYGGGYPDTVLYSIE